MGRIMWKPQSVAFRKPYFAEILYSHFVIDSRKQIGNTYGVTSNDNIILFKQGKKVRHYSFSTSVPT